MSEFKGKIALGVALAIIIAVGLAFASMELAPQIGGGTPSSTTQGVQSLLIVQLTDPPVVPQGTTALNLTYTALTLLVSEPGTTTTTAVSTTTSASSTITTTVTSTQTLSGLVTKSVTITPSGGSATVDLLKLQNISQTIASANLPNGTTVYSVSFTVSSISITINGVTSPVTLATGGNTLLVTMFKPAALQGTNALLLDLSPTIVNTTSGYQMIPSSVGIMKPQSEIDKNDNHVGHQDDLTNQDHEGINKAAGQVIARLVSLSVSGNTTTIVVQVNNTGSTPVNLVAIGIRGNFSQSNTCAVSSSHNDQGDHNSQQSNHGCGDQSGHNEIVFIPSLPSSTTTSTTTSTATSSSTTTTTSTTTTASTFSSCTSGMMAQVNGDGEVEHGNQLVISPGQCITLTFSGIISFGHNGGAIVPSTANGQTYTLHVIASNNAEMKLNCTLPLSANSCTVVSNNNGNKED